jgi:hypothetical protein
MAVRAGKYVAGWVSLKLIVSGLLGSIVMPGIECDLM